MSNRVISIEYTLNDAKTNEKLDSNVGSNPLEFISGMGQIIPGLEKELVNLSEGDKTDVMVEPAEAYGEYNDEALQNLPKEQFAGIDLVEGMSLYGTGEQGETVQVTVKSVQDEEVTIDYNHPMAGRTLMFSVSVLAIREATAEELQTGVVGGLAAAGGCCGGGSCGTHDDSEKEVECCGGEKHDEEHECCGGHDGEGCKNS
ncbi:MAG: peptidylprolyl isomerase [Campylobacterota bacterium]|nr:peptidylprolyl isomerase [Campylobacterota bacterium]